MSKKLPSQTYHDIDVDTVRNKLKFKSLQEKIRLHTKYPRVKKILGQRNIDFEKIREHSAKLIGAGALAGTLLLSPPIQQNIPASTEVVKEVKTHGEANISLVTPQENLLGQMKTILPQKVRALSKDEEKKIEVIFKDVIGIPTKANLEGEHLNTTYGLIGAEQHLRRYPGDTVSQHGKGSVLNEGMAPGLGAWGYFAPSKAKLTPDLVEDEKWYAVVQTLYLPDWGGPRTKYLINWYKYRKVLIVNTVNGNAVVADVADSGPAMFTGKVFGGSPEVMEALGGARYKKGPVVLFFVDDPENKIPLGPVYYNDIVKDLAGLNIQEV